MTNYEFVSMCYEYDIYPAIALENENLVEALGFNGDWKNANPAEIRKILENEF